MLDVLDEDSKKKLYNSSLQTGDVFLNEFKEASHKKFFIVAGLSQDKVYLCSVFINSKIHPSIHNKPKQLELQMPLKKNNNSFLKYDSYVNCAYPMRLDTSKIIDSIINKECTIIGRVDNTDLLSIQDMIIDSGLLSEEEIEMFFFNKTKT